jgi:hypothetical protein
LSGSVASIFEVHPGMVRFRVVPTNAVVVELIIAPIVYVKGKLYTNSRDLPANYWYDVEQFEKIMRETFEDIAHIVYILSDKLYALVFFKKDDETEIVAYDVKAIVYPTT